jgi:hypothetical protein
MCRDYQNQLFADRRTSFFPAQSGKKRVLLSLKICMACANFRISHRRGAEDTEEKFEIRKSLRTLCLCGKSRFPKFWLRLCRARFSAVKLFI